MAKVLSPAAVRKYRGAKRRREIRDGLAQGLYLVVQPNGHKSWALRYRRPDGRPAKLTLGSVDLSGKEPEGDPIIGTPLSLVAARQLAAEQHRQRARGIDVAARHVAEKRRQKQVSADAADHTFAALARRFIDEHAKPETRRWRDTARMLGLDYQDDGGEPSSIKGGLVARWQDREVTTFDGDDLYGVVNEARRIGIPGLVRRRNGASDTQGRAIAAALSKFFSWLVEHRRISANPAIGMYKPPAPKAREVVLSAAETRWFWQACDKMGDIYTPLLKLLLLTGCRLKEVAGMVRSELSEDAMLWTIPGARTKNRRTHLVPLPPHARDLISFVPKVEGNRGLIFTTTGTTPISGWSKLKGRLDAAMLEAAQAEHETTGRDPARVNIQRWRLHDLRRTLVAGMNDIGIPPHVVEAVVNHVSGHKAGVAGVYNKSEYLPERKVALESWARFITLVIDRDLHAAQQRFVANDDKGDNRKKFVTAIAEGGERWSRYLDFLVNGKAAKVVSLPRRETAS